MEVIIHFKNYDLACEKIKTTRNVPYKVETHLTKSDENGLLVTIEINNGNYILVCSS